MTCYRVTFVSGEGRFLMADRVDIEFHVYRFWRDGLLVRQWHENLVKQILEMPGHVIVFV